MPKPVASLTIVSLTDVAVCSGVLPSANGGTHTLLTPTFLTTQLPQGAAAGDTIIQYDDGSITHVVGPAGAEAATVAFEAVVESAEEPVFESLAQQTAIDTPSLGVQQAQDQEV